MLELWRVESEESLMVQYNYLSDPKQLGYTVKWFMVGL